MLKIPLYQVDSFTNELFRGNPAAVCPLKAWLPDHLMQKIAAENNLSETAFFVRNAMESCIRWFTPLLEVDLCGHATLASAHVIFNDIEPEEQELIFESRSGPLRIWRNPPTSGQASETSRLVMDFPVDEILSAEAPDRLLGAFPKDPVEIWRGKTDYMLVFDSEEFIRSVKPDMSILKGCTDRGVIITAPGKECDFVSRFFAPAAGIDEDPVTGSAHTTLTPYWAAKLGKPKMQALQVSARGGSLECCLAGARVFISGAAVTYMRGEILLKQI